MESKMKLEFKSEFNDEYLDGNFEFDDYVDEVTVDRKDCIAYELTGIHDSSENFDNFSPFLSQSTTKVKIETEDYSQFNASQNSDDERLEFFNSSSSGADAQLKQDLFNDKRKFSNEMERQRRKQYSQSLDRVKEVVPENYIKLARHNLGRKNMKKVSYQVLLHALCSYLNDNNKKIDLEESKKQLKSMADDVKKLFKNKSQILDESFKTEIAHFIQEANNLMCSK